jgi:hypothetical protein
MSTFLSIIENAVPVDLCEAMIQRHKELQVSSGNHAHYGANTAAKRKDIAFFFDYLAADLSSQINECLNVGLAAYLDEHPSLDLMNITSNRIKVQETKKGGGFHDWHYERGSGQTILRELTWQIYLNDTVEGEGTTEFLELGIKVQPKQGSLVFFPVDWTHTHRGNPVYNSTKYIATGWYYRTE